MGFHSDSTCASGLSSNHDAADSNPPESRQEMYREGEVEGGGLEGDPILNIRKVWYEPALLLVSSHQEQG